MTPEPVRWRPRAEPLAAVGVYASGRAALALRHRLLADPALERLRGVATRDGLVVLGPELPWVDGVVYLGRDDAAPSLLLPTLLEPEVPVAIVERALLRKAGPAPLAVVPPVVVPCGMALAIDRARLAELFAP